MFTAGQRKRNQEMRPANESMGTQGTGSGYEDIPVFVLSTESSRTSNRNDESGYELLDHGFYHSDADDNYSGLIHVYNFWAFSHLLIVSICITVTACDYDHSMQNDS